MSETFARLLRLDTLPSGADAMVFGFERSMPAWAWAGVVVVIGVFAAWSYHRLEGPRWARVVLAGVRALTLLALAALIAGPRLVESTESTEPDWTLALVDRSASMQVADAPSAGGGRRTREAQLREMLERSSPMWRALAEDRRVVWLGFDAGAFDLQRTEGAPGASPEGGGPAGAPAALQDPTGRRTALGQALEQALRRAAARPLSGVVIFSDGRSIDEPSRATIRLLQAQQVPVHTVALGSAEAIGDFTIRRVDSPGVAFVNDTAPVTVSLERVGGAGGADGALVRLIDARTGLTLAEERARFEEPQPGADGDAPTASATVTLIHTPADAGRAQWAVEIVPDAPDLVPGNNRAEMAVELTDRPMRVLYIDGYPRWEQRYLKNLLIREKSVVSSNLLLAPDRRYTQEGDEELVAVPDSPEAWAEFDAVILGDVEPGVFTDTQLTQLREHVALRGAGLLWVGGPGATPNRWFDTPLADLLPFSESGGALVPIGEPVVLAPAPAAVRLGVMRLGEGPKGEWPAELSDPGAGWSLVRWAQRVDPATLKPAAEALANAILASAVTPAEPAPDGATQVAPQAGAVTPIVLSMRFGAGRTLYVGTDEIWRWRFGRGEMLPERFWIQMLRLLGRESLARSGRPANLTITPRRSVVEQPVRIELELLDQALIDEARPGVAVRLTRAPQPGDETDAPVTVELTLRPQVAPPSGGESSPSDPAPARRLSAVWLPLEPGAWTAAVVEPGMTALRLTAEAQVSLADDELRRPESDHALLARLSAETGGKAFSVENLATLPEFLPNRRVRLLRERFHTLWDTPAALILVVSLLSLEWVGRRVIRLI